MSLSTRAKLAVLFVVALAVAGCGGGGGSPRLSKSEYEQKIKAEGQTLQSAFTALDLNTNKNAKELATKVGKLQTKLEQAANDFDKLNPPKDAVADNKKIALTLHKFADIFGDLKTAASSGNQQKIAAAQSNLLAASQVGTQAAHDLKQKGYDVGVLGGAG
jgi:hypothetical protein